MPDPYWEKVGDLVARKKADGWVVCHDCGAFKQEKSLCNECRIVKCARCGEEFENGRNRKKLCLDCVGKRGGGERSPFTGDRLGGGMETRDDGGREGN